MSEAPPHTHLARVASWDPAKRELTFWLWAQSPNRFHGTSKEFDQLIRDFATDTQDGQPLGAEDYVPHEYGEPIVRDPTQDEALQILSELFARVALVSMQMRAQPDATMSDVLNETDAHFDWLIAIAAGTVDEYRLAPPQLPDNVRNQPAYTWAFRVVDVTLEPGDFPDAARIEQRSQWWPTWA